MYSATANRKCLSPSGTNRSRHSHLIESTKRSAKAFRFGLCAGNLTVLTPARSRIRRKPSVYSGSRSMSTYRFPSRNPSTASTKFRAICSIHGPPGKLFSQEQILSLQIVDLLLQNPAKPHSKPRCQELQRQRQVQGCLSRGHQGAKIKVSAISPAIPYGESILALSRADGDAPRCPPRRPYTLRGSRGDAHACLSAQWG